MNSKNEKNHLQRKLVQEFTDGSSAAFKEIYNRFKKPLQRLVKSRIKNQDLAEDLVQETFIKVFRYRHYYDSKYEFTTWLWTIAKNLTLDHLSSTRVDPLEKIQAETEWELQDLVCFRMSAEDEFFKKSERRELFKVLKRLPRLQRKALLLRVVKGCSYDEIARRLQISMSAVKSLIHRGKVSMQMMGGEVPIR